LLLNSTAEPKFGSKLEIDAGRDRCDTHDDTSNRDERRFIVEKVPYQALYAIAFILMRSTINLS